MSVVSKLGWQKILTCYVLQYISTICLSVLAIRRLIIHCQETLEGLLTLYGIISAQKRRSIKGIYVCTHCKDIFINTYMYILQYQEYSWDNHTYVQYYVHQNHTTLNYNSQAYSTNCGCVDVTCSTTMFEDAYLPRYSLICCDFRSLFLYSCSLVTDRLYT